MKLRVLDLFSGIGGFSLGLERTGGFETVAFCEIEEFPRKVLAKHWPNVPCFEDVRKLKGSDVGTVDVICGGYPCQPFSTAGKRRGQKDDRHLWPEFNRLVAELRPTWVIGENVAGHISMGLDDVLSDLEGQGYTCRTFVIPACAVAAHHRRDRCWTIARSGDVLHARELDTGTDCGATGRGEGSDEHEGQAPHRQRVRIESGTGCEDVADTDTERELQSQGRQQDQRRRSGNCSKDVSNANGSRPQGQGRTEGCLHSETTGNRQVNRVINDCRWPSEPRVGRMANGVPAELDFIGGLVDAEGNYSEAEPEARKLVWQVLRQMWSDRETAKTSPELYLERLRGSLPGVPYANAHGGWLLGRRIEEDEGLRCLWQDFFSQPFEEAQDLQQRVLEQAREKKRPQEMGSRTDRLKALGNAVVPQVVEMLGMAILEAHNA